LLAPLLSRAVLALEDRDVVWVAQVGVVDVIQRDGEEGLALRVNEAPASVRVLRYPEERVVPEIGHLGRSILSVIWFAASL